MPKEYYFGSRPDESGSLVRNIFMFFYLGVLVVAVVIFGWIYAYNEQLNSVIPTFQSALDSGRYKAALEMYRDVQAEVISRDPNQSEDTAEREVLTEMEDIVFTRVDSIENSIRTNRYSPSADDRAFLEQMGELTGSRMTVWLNSLCQEFLLGQIERPTLQFVFDSVADYANITAAATPLEKEFDQIEQARGDISTAENYYNTKSYIEAVETYEDIIAHTTGFVSSYAQARLQTCEKEMYQPIMDQCDHLLKTYRYYTAEDILSDMARIFPDDQKVQSKLLEATSNTSPVVDYKGNVEVLCVKPLIADTTVAFSGTQASTADSLCLTAGEFEKILEQVYKADYILIDVRTMTDQTNLSSVTEKTLTLPEGKKPLVIVFENANYSAYQKGMGTCNRLVLNDQNQVCGEYTNANGQTVVSRGSEAIGILDAFVESHPDFSFDGAKGIISFSGYETMMGYIVNADQVDDRNSALQAVSLPAINPSEADIQTNQTTVKAILSVLSDNGWVFASSTYGFINANSCDLQAIQNDTNKWLDQIGSLTGAVQILVYPNGDFIKGSDPRCGFLKENGFRIFFGVGPTPYYTFGDNYLYLDRAMLNGDTLRKMDYSRLFDADQVYDTSRPLSLH